MTQDRIVFNSPDLSPQWQEHPSLISPRERVARQRVSLAIPSISIEESPSYLGHHQLGGRSVGKPKSNSCFCFVRSADDTTVMG